MKSFRFLASTTLLFLLLFLASCDAFSQKAGTFSVKFSWAKDRDGNDIKPDISGGDFYVTVRMYEWAEGVNFPGDIAAHGRQIVQSDPTQMKVTGTSINFGNLSYGNRRFVVAEIRRGADLTGGILYTGMSQLFDFKVGKHTEVNVEMSLAPTPGVDETGTRIDAELRIVGDDGSLRGYLNKDNLNVKLRLINAVSFTKVFIANKEEFIKTDNGKEYQKSALTELEDKNSFEIKEKWDLSSGLTTDEIAVLPELKVYARVENEYGQGLLLMAKIALDNDPPQLTLGINPSYTNGSKPVMLNISANELIRHDTLNIQTTNTKLEFDCPVPTRNESLSFSCTIETLDAGIADGNYEIKVGVSDQAGNLSEDKISVVIDRTPPLIAVNSCTATTRREIDRDGIAAATYDDVVEITFDMEVEEGVEPVITLGGVRMTEECSVQTGRYCYAHRVDGKDIQGFKFAGIDAIDSAGNIYSETLDECVVIYDFSPPRVVGHLLTREADFAAARDEENQIQYYSIRDPLTNNLVTAKLAVYADKKIDQNSVALSGFNLGTATVTSETVKYNRTLTDSDDEGVYTLSIEWADDLGNVTENPIKLEWQLAIDKTEPGTDGIDMEKVLYTRKPWGTDDTGGIPGFSIAGEDGSITDSGIASVNVYNELGLLIGNSPVDSEGKFEIPVLTGGDIPRIFLNPVKKSGVRVSGNGALVTEVSWHATMGGKVPGSTMNNIHRFFSVPVFTSTLEQNRLLSLEPFIKDIENLSLVDNKYISKAAQTIWLELYFNSNKPLPRSNQAMIYDSARGKVVMFGGKSVGSFGDIWEWDSATGTWTDRTSDGTKPGVRREPAMVYDSKRGKVVMLGGDTWEWDGATGIWTERAIYNFGPRVQEGHAMAYDASREKVVMFGGWDGSYRQSIWEWDGENGKWTDITPDGTKPSARRHHAMAYDNARGKVVMFGGFDGYSPLQDIWEWDGETGTWTNRTPDGAKPIARRHHAMAYDNVRGKVVMLGGSTSTGRVKDIWEWDGETGTWTDITPDGSKPSAREAHSAVFDSVREKVVMFGGDTGSSNDETWEWDSSTDTWTNRTPVDTKPIARTGHAIVYDTVRNKAILFGGQGSNNLQDLWEWDIKTGSWTDRTPEGTKPTARTGHSMIYDSARGKVVLFGGYTNSYNNETWEWDGVNWTHMNPITKPSVRRNHAMAYDSARRKVVLFGGWDTNRLQDIWEWDGEAGTWTDRTPHEDDIQPTPRYNHAMTFDRSRDKIVMFGGTDGGVTLDQQDLWEWDGETGTWTDRTPAGTKPLPSSGHSMVYDGTHKKVVLFKGSSKKMWAWDGKTGAWNDRTPDIENPSGIMFYYGTRGKIVTGDLNVWEWDGGYLQRAAQIIKIVFPVSGFIPETVDLRSFTSSFFVGGTGYTGLNCSAVDGAKMMVWNTELYSGSWMEVASNSAGSNAVDKLEFTTNNPNLIKHLFFGDEKAINIAVTPISPNGCGIEMGSIATDYAEVIIRYRITDDPEE